MKKYPIGIQDFRELRKGGYLYVDKTKKIAKVIESGKYYFLSRPRRFGKSLLISTLKYLFQGERELFEGLWLEGKYDFQPHPVLHFSFSTLGYKDIGLEAGLFVAALQLLIYLAAPFLRGAPATPLKKCVMPRRPMMRISSSSGVPEATYSGRRACQPSRNSCAPGTQAAAITASSTSAEKRLPNSTSST